LNDWINLPKKLITAILQLASCRALSSLRGDREKAKDVEIRNDEIHTRQEALKRRAKS